MKTKLLTSTVLCVLFHGVAAAQTDILLAELSLPRVIDRWYQAEYDRLTNLCRGDAVCAAQNGHRKTWPSNTVYSAPDRRSRRLGELVVRADFSPATRLHFRIDYRTVDGDQRDWIRDLGDWGYGIEAFVLARRGSWVQLPKNPFPVAVWIELARRDDESMLRGHVGSVVGNLVSVGGDVPAIDLLTGRSGMLPEDTNFFVERISRGHIFLRKEVGADMPCGDEAAEKHVVTYTTPRYRVLLSHLFGRDGRPRVSRAYPKGC